MPAPRWTPAFELDDLPPGQARLFKTDTHRVAIFRTEGDDVYAVDNACPHEGYPLVQGDAQGTTLTCAWHNFKFDLRDGACLKGDEAVRAYPVRRVGDTVEVDLEDPDPGLVADAARRSLEEAVRQGQQGRMARDVVRCLQAGLTAPELLARGAGLDGRIGEYGTTHALPVACDLLLYLNGDLAHDALVVAHLMEQVSDPNQRRDEHPLPRPRVTTNLSDDLYDAVEREDVDTAVALIRGAVQPGADLTRVQAALLRVASAHFLGFGHPLIYTVKAFDLLAAVGPPHAEAILTGLVRRVVNSTREDTLPPMKTLRAHLDQVAAELTDAWSTRTSRPTRLEPVQVSSWVDRILDPGDGTVREEFSALIRGDVHLADLVDVLSLAAAQRLLHFDASIHDDPTQQDNWLFVTHPFTFVNAVRAALERADHPSVLRCMYFALEFIRRSHRLETDAREPVALERATADDVLAAIAARTPEVAVSAMAGWAAAGSPDDLEARLRRWILTGPATTAIFLAHLIKTTRAAFQEARTIAHPDLSARPLLALARYLATPVAERGLAGAVHDAFELVVHGKLPKRLAS